jgi:3-deoxy-manno-octulosonate cytidylyltransferase (CMP-KDO synthetase)
MSVIAIIPARMASSRFPGKPLIDILGISMIEHVRRRALLCPVLDDVIVATCDQVIIDEVERYGGKAVLNIQGDMPLVHPQSLEQLIDPLLKEKELSFTDMAGPVTDEGEMDSLNTVKVVFDKSFNALYYSREPIPSKRKMSKSVDVTLYKQFGINAFRHDSLLSFANTPRTMLENVESIDMLRLLENGKQIRVVLSEYPVVGVDTEQDADRVRLLMKKDPFYARYKEQAGKC